MKSGLTWCGLLAAGVFFLSTSAPELRAQAGRARVQEGNRLYEQGLFAEAHQKYLEAMAEVPESSVIPFNDGNALYQGSDYERAMEAYQRAIESGDPAVAGTAWYNLGNAFYRQQQLEQSLEAYKQALRLNPGDPDAKHNLERVLEEMQQRQDQQDQGDQDQDQDQEQQDQQQQDQQQDQGQGQDPPPPNEDQPEDGEPQQQESQPEEGDQPPDDEAGQPQPQQGEMTPEEAERLLDAVDETPEDVNRKPAAALGRRPKKPW